MNGYDFWVVKSSGGLILWYYMVRILYFLFTLKVFFLGFSTVYPKSRIILNVT